MEKSVFSREYAVLTAVLREFRTNSGLTQEQLAAKLRQSQSYISKYERGELRLDLVQLRQYCKALGTTLPALVAVFEERLAARRR